ncbi:MAG: phosphoribosylformylglycinamidine cyclo-ligase [Oligoflexia bacterium]|nr:phosphoribosylformylglycinamidine cyclo-ligase [Oligoflexia bacterium]
MIEPKKGKRLSIDYKASGVDVEAGDDLVDWIKNQKPVGAHKNVLSGVGGFSALFKLDLKKYKKPVLVSCTDGVGTKVRLSAEFDQYEPTGIDLVAMCVNDLIVCGADPLFFLDYYASGKLNLNQAQDFLKGVIKGLKMSDCNLIGGETAEMPGHYSGKDYDCAGFCVGAINEDEIIDGSKVVVGDVAVGVASSGFHSNGFSLLRKLFEKDQNSYKEELLTPTRIYVELVKQLKNKIKIKAMAHITGGGIIGNAARTLPKNTALKLQKWPWPDLFLEVQKRSGLSTKGMLETFNCGIGYVFFVSQKDEEKVIKASKEFGWSATRIGSVIEHKGEACVTGV